MAQVLDFNEIDAAMAQDADEAVTSNAIGAVRDAVGVNPDEYAKHAQMAKQTDLPVETVARDPQSVEKGITQDQVLEMFNETPEAKTWLTDNAKLVSDDFSTVSRWKKNLHDMGESFLDDRDRNRLAELRAAQMDGDVPEYDKIEAQVLSDELANAPQRGTGSTASEVAQLVAGNAYTTGSLAKSAGVGGVAGGAVGGAVGGLVGLLGGPFAEVTVPAGAGTGARFGAKWGARSKLVVDDFNLQRGLIYDDMLRIRDEDGKGIDPDVAKGAAIFAALPSAALDTFSFGKLAETVPGLGALKGKLTREGMKDALKVPGVREAMLRIGKTWAKAATAEGVTEGAQQAIQIMGEEVAKAESDGKFKQRTVSDWVSESAEAARQGFIVGGAYGVPGSAVSAVQAARTPRANPVQVQAHVDNINQTVRSDKLFQRDPQAFHSLMNTLAPDQHFYVDGEQAQNVIGSLDAEKQAQLFNAVPSLRDELETAAATGADVKISKADYASFIAPYPQADQLRDHIKLDPADETVGSRQALQEFLAKNPEAAKQVQQQLGEVPPNATVEQITPAIERIFRKAMMDAGRTSVESRAVAPLFARSMARFAAPFGDNAIAGLNQRLVEFRSVDPQNNTIKSGSNISVMLKDLQDIRAGKNIKLDDTGRQLVEDFGSRLEQAGLSPQGALALKPAELLDRLYPPKDPIDASLPAVSLEQTADGGYQLNLGPQMDQRAELEKLYPEQQQQDATTNPAISPIEGLPEGVPVNTDSQQFKEWFGDSKVVDEDGKPLVVYHGTTHDITEFDPSKANIDNDLGAGFYFTNNRAEVSENYAGEGPDLTNRIEQRTDQLSDKLIDQFEEKGRKEVLESLYRSTGELRFVSAQVADMDDMDAAREAARVLARKELSGGSANVIPAYLSIKNPVEVGGENETQFDYGQEYDEESDEYGDETGSLVGLVDALRSVASDFDDADVERGIGNIMDIAGGDGGISAGEFISILKGEPGGIIYATDENGDLAGNEIIRRAFEYAGYDGIIDRTVNVKFGSERARGRSMAGMGEGTVHYITFKPQQIKSIFNKGTWSPESPNILLQAAYHGSPHDFDKFTLDHIGSGEGANAYGWGLYFASNKQVAKFYKDKLAKGDPKDPKAKANEIINKYFHGDEARAISDVATQAEIDRAPDPEFARAVISAMRDGSYKDAEMGGKLYEVEIPDDHEMLAWDAKLKAQPDVVKKAIDAIPSDDVMSAWKTNGAWENITGAALYSHLAGDGLRGNTEKAKAASLLFNSLGVKGIKYLDAGSRTANEFGRSHNYVVFDDAAIQMRNSLEQTERGSIEFRGNNAEQRLRNVVINFTEQANFSTAAHEFSHFAVATHRYFAELARERITSGETNPEIQRIADDWETLKQEIGAESDNFTVDQEERVASMFEQYLRTGTAPSEKLRLIFTRFRDWLTKIYRDLRELGEPVSPKVSEVFDRWLASEEEITKVREKNSALAQIAQNFGLPADITTRIADYVNSATSKAESSLYRKLDIEQRRMQTKAYKDEFKKMRGTVAQELGAKKEYNLLNYLKENGFKMLAGPETKGIPEEYLGDGENAVHPDVIADLYGYNSGQEMLTAVRAQPPFESAVNRETRKRLLTKYPDMIQDGRIHNEAVDAILNDRTLLALDLMIKELGGANRIGLKQFANAMAQQQVEKMKLSEAGYSFRYEIAREREMREALRASRAGKTDEALLHLQRALVSQIVYKQIQDFNELRDKAEKLFKRVSEKDRDLAPTKDIDFLGAARYILKKFGLGGENFDVNAWMEDVQQRNPDVVNDLVMLSQMVAAPDKPAKDLTIAEFRDIYNSVQNIYHTAHSMKEFEKNGKKYRTDAILGDLLKQMGDVKKSLHEGTSIVGLDRVRNNLSTVKAAMRRVELWAKSMDGGSSGPFSRFIYDTAKQAETSYHTARTEWMRGYAEILKKYETRLNTRGKIETNMIKSDALGRQARLVWKNRMEMIGFMLHTGNESNLDKLLGGYGIDPEQYAREMRRLERAGIITAADWKMVQELWDYVEKLKPIAQQAHKKLYGFRFDEIESRPFDTEHGTVRGGYWPAIADTEQAANNKTVEQMLEQNRQYMLATVGKGFTKNRVQGYRQPLKTDLRLGSQHIDKVLRFANLEPAVRDISRLINRQEFREKLKAQDFDAFDGMLMPWLARFASQSTEEAAPIGDRAAQKGRKLLSFMKAGAIAQIMYYNAAVPIQNVANMPVAAHLVGYPALARAWASTTVNPIGAIKAMKEASPYMKNRLSTDAVKISNTINQIAESKGGFSKSRDFLNRNGFIFMHVVDSYLGTITWQAAYNKAMKENGIESEAIRLADSAVRQVMGASGAVDVSKIEAGHPLLKAIMPFYSYFNSQLNLIGTEFKNIAKEHGWAGSPKMFMTYLSLVAAPAILGDLIIKGLRGQELPGDDDDGEPLEDWMAWAVGSQLKYLGAGVPFANQGMDAVLSLLDLKPTDQTSRTSLSPVVSAVEKVGATAAKTKKLIEGDDVNDARYLRDVMNTLGFALNIPLGQVAKPLAYAVDVEQGESTADSPGEVLQGVMSGPQRK